VERIRVIIADDHAVVREGTRHILETDPEIEVVGEAANGVEAVELTESLLPDVAIIDIAMPVMGGLEATARIKSSRPQTAVLILTAYDDDAYIFAVLESGAAGYLLKDVPSAELIRAVRAVHRGEPALHPAIARKVMARFAAQARVAHADGLPRPVASPLTDRERDVLRLAASGMTNNEIATRLFASLRTIQAHLTQIFNKLGVGSRTEAVVAGLRAGILNIEDLDER
jgi:DNA-binding NarL/FixJ family response regulator